MSNEKFMAKITKMTTWNNFAREKNMGIEIWFNRALMTPNEFAGEFEISIASIGSRNSKQTKERVAWINSAIQLVDELNQTEVEK